jgi:hypothetical protein
MTVIMKAVIPAKAGIQIVSGFGWLPAFAGVRGKIVANDESGGMIMRRITQILALAVLIAMWTGSALAAEERITTDTRVTEIEQQLAATGEMVVTQTNIELGGQERPAKIIMSAAGVAYQVVMEFIYEPYETADGKKGYPCVGVNRYAVRQ